MTREEIISMAREAGMAVIDDKYSLLGFLERFAALVAEREREECAKVCDDISMQAVAAWKSAYQPQDQGREIGADECAAAIRARGGAQEALQGDEK